MAVQGTEHGRALRRSGQLPHRAPAERPGRRLARGRSGARRGRRRRAPRRRHGCGARPPRRSRRGTSRRRPRRRRARDRSPSTGLTTVSPSATGSAGRGRTSGPSTGSSAISPAARAGGGGERRAHLEPVVGEARPPAATRSPSDRVPKAREPFLEQPEGAGHGARQRAAGRHRVETGGREGGVGRGRGGARRRRRAPPGRSPARRGSGSRRHPARTARARRRTARARPPRRRRSRSPPRRAGRHRRPWRADRRSRSGGTPPTTRRAIGEKSMLNSVHPAEVQEWERCTTTSFSVDDHIIEPPNVWTDRLPARYQEAGPHVVEDDGREYWVYEGRRGETMGLNAVAGKERKEYSMDPVRYTDMIPGCYDPVAAGARTCSPTASAAACASRPSPGSPASRSSSPTTRSSPTSACKAYNDWLIDEWCASVPGHVRADDHRPAVGSGADGRRGPALRRPRRPGDHVPGEPGAARAAVVLDRPLGPAVGGVRARPTPSCACTSARAAWCRWRRATRRSSRASPCPRPRRG